MQPRKYTKMDVSKPTKCNVFVEAIRHQRIEAKENADKGIFLRYKAFQDMEDKKYMEAKARKEASLKYYQRRAMEIDPEEEYKKMESQLKLLGDLKSGLIDQSTLSISRGLDTERTGKFHEEPAVEIENNATTMSALNIKDEDFANLKTNHHSQKWLQTRSTSIEESPANINWNFDSEESTREHDSFSTIEVLLADSLWSDWSSSWGSGWVLEEEDISDFAWVDWKNWAHTRQGMDKYFESRLERKAEKRRMEREWFCLDWLFREKKEEEVELSESICDEPSDLSDERDQYLGRIKNVFSVPLHWFLPKAESLAERSALRLLQNGKHLEELVGRSLTGENSNSTDQAKEVKVPKLRRFSELTASALNSHDSNSEVSPSNQQEKLEEDISFELTPQELREVYEENGLEYGWPEGDFSDHQIAAHFLAILLLEKNNQECESGDVEIEFEYPPNLGISAEDMERFMSMVRGIMKDKVSFEEVEDKEVERALVEAGY